MFLSLVMPVYNEGDTLLEAVRRLGKVDMPIPWELIIVDDGSDDDAVGSLDGHLVSNAERVLLVRARRNRGKGSALRKGFQVGTGTVMGVLDADLELDPGDIPKIVEPLTRGEADAVFGARLFPTDQPVTFVVGNRVMSLAASLLFGRNVTDAYTCYKFFTRDVYEELELTANGFEIEAELVGGILRSARSVKEVPVSYLPRTHEEGKKIRPKDGLKGLVRLFRVRVLGR